MRTSGYRWTAAALVATTLATMATHATAYQGGGPWPCNGWGYEQIGVDYDFDAYHNGTVWKGKEYQDVRVNCFTNGSYGCPYSAVRRLYIKNWATTAWDLDTEPPYETRPVPCMTFGLDLYFRFDFGTLFPGRQYMAEFDLYTGNNPGTRFTTNTPIYSDYDTDQTY